MDIKVPAYYILSRSMDKALAEPILHALNITPIAAGVIDDIHDAELALMFTPQILRCETEAASCETAMTISTENDSPVLVIGTADVLDAIYSDGERKAVIGTA